MLAEVPPNPADFPQRRIQGGISMKPRPSRHFSPVSLGACLLVLCCLASSPASADAIYTITDLGTLSGQSSSVATSINNLGQVVGISYNSADGYFRRRHLRPRRSAALPGDRERGRVVSL